MTDRLTVVSTDCHAGLPIAQYKPYVDSKYHDFIDMAVDIQIEMMDKAEQQFLIKEINDEWRAPIQQELTGADYKSVTRCWRRMVLRQKLFSMASPSRTHPFGAGLGLSPKDAVPELQWAGDGTQPLVVRACCQRSEASLGVASIPLLFDVDQAVEAVRCVRKMASKASCYPPCGASTRPITT